MDEKQAKALREPFPAGAIGKLPKPYKSESPKGNCGECGGYHGLPAVHLDYVGHAATTDRLLAVDPSWTWEPLALDERGLPAMDNKGNLWIRLTIGGVTRLGVGDGPSAKVCIGDAIRNAAMRFGVALDLWAKEDLHDIAQERVDHTDPMSQARGTLADAWLEAGNELDKDAIAAAYEEWAAQPFADAKPDDLLSYARVLRLPKEPEQEALIPDEA